MPSTPLAVDRQQILRFRRATNGLGARAPRSARTLRRAALVGLQDSMPRAATLSLHARLDDVDPLAWDDPAFVQVWGPRYSAYVIPASDVATFTLGRLPDDERGRKRAFDTARELRGLLGHRSMDLREAARSLGGHPTRLRYAATTGTVAIRWDGARQPTVRMLEPPDVDPWDARKELVRRFLHVFGPSTPEAFGAWAGIKVKSSAAAFARLRRSMTLVATPIGDAWILNKDVDRLRNAKGADGSVRLLPSGDAYFLLQGDERRLLVPKAARQSLLWTPRVWPGAILADGAILGTWRRSTNVVSASLWTKVPRRLLADVEAEAMSLPIPEVAGSMRLDFAG